MISTGILFRKKIMAKYRRWKNSNMRYGRIPHLSGSVNGFANDYHEDDFEEDLSRNQLVIDMPIEPRPACSTWQTDLSNEPKYAAPIT